MKNITGRCEQFRITRARVLSNAAALGLRNPGRRGGRWSEKLLTVTVPHLLEHSARQRLDLAFHAKSLFQEVLMRQLRSCESPHSTAWFSTFEWTLAADDRGHPVSRFWLFCPFLDLSVLRDAWSQSLQVAGFAKDAAENGLLDLCQVVPGSRSTTSCDANYEFESGLDAVFPAGDRDDE